MKSTTVNFSVCGEGITRLVRQIYLYEEKEKAWNIMGTLDGITIDQSKAIFEGNAKLKNDPKDGSVVLLVYEEDTEWKKEFTDHLSMLKKREEKSRYVNDLVYDFCARYDAVSTQEAEMCIKQALKYKLGMSSEEICSYARKIMLRVDIVKFSPGVDIEPPISTVPTENTLEDLQNEANIEIAKKIFINSFTEKDKEKKKINDELIKKFAMKRYSFEFKNHSYTYNDSARNQGECAHCDEKCPDGFFWKETDEGYLGYYDFGQGEVAVCFECPQCFEYFYYHYDKNSFLRKLERNEEK